MDSYSDFPPRICLLQVLKTVPRAALMYIHIWKKKKKNVFSIYKRHTQKILNMSPTVFRNNLEALTRLEILTYDEVKNTFLIELTDLAVCHDETDL